MNACLIKPDHDYYIYIMLFDILELLIKSNVME